jgi:hypothetical protein
MDIKRDRHCFDCNKTFASPANYRKHQARKTPCVKHAEAGVFACEFCDKNYKQKRNLIRHVKTCKAKKEVDTNPVAKLEHEMKTLKNEVADLKKQNQQLVAAAPAPAPTQQTINGNVTINNTIQINNYDDPNIEGLVLTLKELLGGKISVVLLNKIYERPENKSIKSFGKRDKRYEVCVDGKMIKIQPEHLAIDLSNVANRQGADLLNNKNGPFQGDEQAFLKLPEPIKNRIVDFNSSGHEARVDKKDLPGLCQ